MFTPIRLFHILSGKNQKAFCVLVAFYATDKHKIGANCEQKEDAIVKMLLEVGIALC